MTSPTVEQLMSQPVTSVDEHTSVRDVARVLVESGFNGVPITTRLNVEELLPAL
jgi:CBS domain-containing protein